MTKKWAWLIVTLLLVSSVYADFSLKINPESQTITQEQTAEFDITITHSEELTESFDVYSPDVIWDIRTEKPLLIEPNDKFVTKLLIRPLNVNPGLYGIPLKVRHISKQEIKDVNLQLEVLSKFPPAESYLPGIRGEVIMPGIVDPRELITFKVVLENQNKRDLKDVDIKVRSAVINKDYTADLGPLEKKEIELTARADPLSRPQRDWIKVSVIAAEADQAFQFDLEPMQYEVQPYGDIAESVDTQKEFLKNIYTVTVTNAANHPITEKFRQKTGLFQNIFSSAEPKAKKVAGELEWEIELDVSESIVLQYKINYQPLFAIILIGLIFGLAYYLFRSPIAINKTASVISTREGGISELRILLEISNRSKNTVKNVRLIDMVPRIAELIKQYDQGTLIPDKTVKHEKKGTLVKWTIEELPAHEERVISYKVRSKLSILGGVTLPVAVAKYESKSKEGTTKSNAPIVNLGG